jgi:hypothetical protein
VPVSSLPQAAMRLLLQEQPYHGTVRTHIRAVAGLRGHHRPLRAPTLEVEALLLLRRNIPEVGGLVRSKRVLAGLTGQDDLFLVGVNKGRVLYLGYGELVTYYQVLIMFALLVKLISLTLNFPFFPDPGPPLRFYQHNCGCIVSRGCLLATGEMYSLFSQYC